MNNRSSYTKLNLYLGKEYIFSFLISFIFFFFIFFVNQILVIAQKIMLKNVMISDVLLLVVLAIPQFLMYTMPFSSLASASMVIGNFSSQNEIIAMRSCGIHTKRIFIPIVFLSVLVSALTLLIADVFIPYTALCYRDLYAKLLTGVPTLELKSFSSTQFKDRMISNGLVKDDVIHDIMIFDNTNYNDNRVIVADSARISVVDLDHFIYRIDLDKPEIFITDNNNRETYSLAKAQKLILNIDLSSSASGYSNINPSQMSLNDLWANIKRREPEQKEMLYNYSFRSGSANVETASYLKKIESDSESSDNDFYNYINSLTKIENLKIEKPFSFYYQYYRSELNKKFALSIACTCLVFLAFPLSFIKVKYGRLVGFGLSMFCACIYWFYLYYMHLTAVNTPINPAFFMWLPNATVLLVGILLLKRMAKS